MLSLRGLHKKAAYVLCALLLLVTVSAAATRHAKKGTTKSASSLSKTSKSTKSKESSTSKAKSSRSASKGKKSRRGRTVARRRGQQAITSDRTREIQEALIREHYLQGEPTGVWDQETKNALVRYQQENGWQSKIVPDSRALIKLGLGPTHDGLLNPDSAALSSPRELGEEREIPGGAIPQR